MHRSCCVPKLAVLLPPHSPPLSFCAALQRRVVYLKHMAKHRIGVDRELLRRGRHFLLVR
jgi:hypothetical protein